MTLSDTRKITALQDLCGGRGIGKERGLFVTFSFLDLKVKVLKRMESSKFGIDRQAFQHKLGGMVWVFPGSSTRMGPCLQESPECFLPWVHGNPEW